MLEICPDHQSDMGQTVVNSEAPPPQRGLGMLLYFLYFTGGGRFGRIATAPPPGKVSKLESKLDSFVNACGV